MEQFYINFKALTEDQRKEKLNKILMFLRQHNAHEQAEAFQELKNCYPKFPFSLNERAFREYLAWNEIYLHQEHQIVKHIISQG
jgi:hypothetical protein